MTKLKCCTCRMLFITLLLVACSVACSAEGMVNLCVSTKGAGPGSNARAVLQGCTIKFTVYAYDCDEHNCECCPEDLTFPDWPLEEGPPPNIGGTYRGEYIVECDWEGLKEFVFRADDIRTCNDPYRVGDDPAEARVTVMGVKLLGLYGPAGPFCPGDVVTYWAGTDPVTGYGGLLTWQGGDPLPNQSGNEWRTKWTTPGNHTVTVSGCDVSFSKDARVYEPVHEVTILEPGGMVGGAVPVRVQVRQRCDSLKHTGTWPDLVPALRVGWQAGDPPAWVWITGWYKESEQISDGVRTVVYRGYWNTTTLKNATYTLTAEATFLVGSDRHEEVVSAQCSVPVLNLSFTSPDSPSVLEWKGEEGETESVAVTLVDNDLSDPMTLTMRIWPTCMDNSVYVPDAVTSITLTGVTGGNHTFVWDGCAPDWSGARVPVEPGLYTYDVVATQTDIGSTNPSYEATDTARLRSEHVHIKRATEAVTGNPIYDVDYDGYDDNGTPDNESDDKYLYVIRQYGLNSTYGITASEGWVWLYDPTLTKVYERSIVGLECLMHPGLKDGVCPGSHAIRIPVPVSAMPYAGEYRFVLHIKDDHGSYYRNGQDRWALELNADLDIVGYSIYSTNTEGMPGIPDPVDTSPFAADADRYVQRIWDPETGRVRSDGYRPWYMPGNPEQGGSGLFTNKSTRATIHTLDRLCPTEIDAPDVGKSRNAVWAYYGHGVPGRLDFPSLGSIAANGPEVHRSQRYSLVEFTDLKFLLFVYLAACHSADGMAAAFVRNGNGAKAAVGFHGKLEINTVAFHPFGVYNKRLWYELCEKGRTVDDANKIAKKAAEGAYVKWFGNQPDPEVFGNGATRLTPPRYGDRVNHSWE